MRPELERVKQQLRSGDVSQDVLDSLANALPTDSIYEDIFRGAPADFGSFQAISERLQRLNTIVKTPKMEEMKHTVRFIDYDGTIVKEVGLEELPLANMPKAPDHSKDLVPLVFTGWTMPLDKINAAEHFLDVGAKYKAADGNTHLVVNITRAHLQDEGNGFGLLVTQPSEEVVIDWGNGESVSVSASATSINVSTTYRRTGLYDVCIRSNDSALKIEPSINPNGVTSWIVGDNVRTIKSFNSLTVSSRLESIVIPDGVTTIEYNAFRYVYSLRNIIIPNSVRTIGGYAFESLYCAQSIVIGDGVQEIGGSAFYTNNVQRLVIPDSVTTLGEDAIKQVNALQGLVIGDGLQTISYNFYYCASLQYLLIGKGLKTIGSNSFYSSYSLRNLVIPDNVETRSSTAFYYCYSLQSLIIGDGLQSIDGFGSAYNLQELSIGKNVSNIGSYAFQYCYSLQKLVIPDNVTSISYNAFQCCYSLQSLTLGKGLEAIGSSAFSNCCLLRSLVIPDSVTSIGTSAFMNCYSLQDLVIPDNVTSIGYSAFQYCYSLQNLIIGNGLQTIDSNVFNKLFSLKRLVIGKNVSVIKTNALGGGSNRTYAGLTIYIMHPKGALDVSSFKYAEIIWYYNLNIVGLEIKNSSIVHGSYTTIDIGEIIKGDDELQESDIILPLNVLENVVVTCSDNATVEGRQIQPLVDSGYVTVTVTVNDSSNYTVTKEIEIVKSFVDIDLNDGQWVETEETVDGNTVYKSDAGSYHINNGLSRCTISVLGYDTLSIWARTSSEKSYDYIVLGNVNQTATRSSYKTQVDNNSNSFVEVSYDLDRTIISTIDILYTKDSSDNRNDDRGYFYFTVE